jgi:hypothetical protein
MQVIQTLEDIASHLQIRASDLVVIYYNYQLLKAPRDFIAQLQKLPQEIQDEYLNLFLRSLIAGIYFNGLPVVEKRKVVKLDYRIGSENTASEVDWEFYEQLHKNNQGKGWWNPGFRVLRQEVDGSLAVQKRGLTVHIQRDRHLQLEEQSVAVGDLVSVYYPSSLVKDQYYVAAGNFAGALNHSLVFIYFNFSPEGAVAVMRELTTKLNEMEIPFSFDVLYNPSNYGRYDSGLLRINKDSYGVVRRVLQTVYAENELYFQTQVPIFTKVLAPGLALAEKTEKEFRFLEGFGMNRCTIVANALLEAHKNSDESKEARMKYIFQHFEKLDINLECPYLNPNSEDIYTPLG